MTQKSDKYLHKMEVEWLSESAEVPTIDEFVDDVDAEAVLEEMRCGEFCGTTIYRSCQTLSHDDAVKKLIEFGNDGKFFDTLEVGDGQSLTLREIVDKGVEDLTTKFAVDAAANAKESSEASDASRTVLMQSISYREEVDLINKAETLIDLDSAEIKPYQQGDRVWVIIQSQYPSQFWSRIRGWTVLELATIFSSKSYSTYQLPAGGQWKEAVIVNGLPVLLGVILAENDPCPYIVPRPKFGLMLRAKRTRWTDLGRISKKQFFVRFSFLAETQIVVEMCPYSLVEMPNAPDKTPYVVFDNDQDALRFFLGAPYLSTIDGVKRYVVVHLDDDGNLVGQ